MPDEEQEDPKIYLVGLKDCEACTSLEETLVTSEGVGKKLRAKYGTDSFKTIYPEDATESKDGELAANICLSLKAFQKFPILVVMKKKDGSETRVCELDDDLDEKKCAIYKELPK